MGEIWLLKWAILAKFGAKMAIFDQSELGTLHLYLHSNMFHATTSYLKKTLQTWASRCEISTFNAIIEKSTMLIQSYSNFQRMIYP